MDTAPRNATMKSADMDLKPFMNLMVVLIPMLLLSAEFARVAVIDIQLPTDTGTTPRRQETPSAETVAGKMRLTAMITDSTLTIGAKGGFLPTMHYREYHRYTARDDHTGFTVEYRPGIPAVHPVSGRAMSERERDDLLLYSCDERQVLRRGIYTPYGELITDATGTPLTAVETGDSVFALSLPRRLIVVSDPGAFASRPLSVYDELQNRLMKIKERYREAVDRDAIIIAAENGVIYDKIIQIMDTARRAQFPDISICRIKS
ncbi:MAG: hypothetical protein JW863_00605 [Chitinispirillaceae bacterium]|nr:hypothetical protein [Chitinispirillaceae bacterium]